MTAYTDTQSIKKHEVWGAFVCGLLDKWLYLPQIKYKWLCVSYFYNQRNNMVKLLYVFIIHES
jgi:hypothetical protein